MNETIIWRNDDVSRDTNLHQLQRIHDLFIRYNVTHTVAIICKGLDQNVELVNYLKNTPNFDLQVHCWEHVDYTLHTNQVEGHLKACIKMFETCGFKEPTTFYPCWNKSNLIIADYAARLGLETSNQKCSLNYYVSHAGNVSQNVINFHSWSPECSDLEAALKIYTNKIDKNI